MSSYLCSSASTQSPLLHVPFINSCRCKMACLEREYRQLWQSIHRGWEWIRNDLRSRLRQKWLHVYVNDGTDGESVCPEKQDGEHISFMKSSHGVLPVSEGQREREGRTSSHVADKSYRAYHTCEESAEYVRAIRSEAEALRESLKASETLRKAIRKLTSLNWVLCYERYCTDTQSHPILSYPILSLSSLDFLHLLFAFMRCHAVPTCMLLHYIYCMRAARLEISYHALIGTTTSRHCIFSPYLVASCFQYKSGAQSTGRGTCSRLKGALGRPQPE